MIYDVKNQGSSRRGMSLTSRPPRIYAAVGRKGSGNVPIFEPFEENLPLEAGWYSYVIDEEGRFRVKRGHHSSHSTMVDGGGVGAAGLFRINRAGNVAEVACRSYDYRINIPSSEHAIVGYLRAAFANHHALEVSPWVIFQFARGMADSFYVDIKGQPLTSLAEHRARLDEEGQGSEAASAFPRVAVERFRAYQPDPAPRLYGMHADQIILAVEGDDDVVFQVGPPMPRYSPDLVPLNSGPKAFVMDEEGWLIAGAAGHHLLSGGRSVGAAGRLVLDAKARVVEVNLNFSGHYRPPLDSTYARFVHRSLRRHPLLSFAEDYSISGRKFHEGGELSTLLRFDPRDLESEDVDLDLLIEVASF